MRRFSPRIGFTPAGLTLVVATLTATLGAGCYTTGRKVDQQTLGDLRPGLTTCLEIRERYGPPTSATIASEGQEQLRYVYQHSQIRPLSFIPIASMLVRGADTEATNVVFTCQGGVLTAYSSTQGQMGSGSGFISGGRQP